MQQLTFDEVSKPVTVAAKPKKSVKESKEKTFVFNPKKGEMLAGQFPRVLESVFHSINFGIIDGRLAFDKYIIFSHLKPELGSTDFQEVFYFVLSQVNSIKTHAEILASFPPLQPGEKLLRVSTYLLTSYFPVSESPFTKPKGKKVNLYCPVGVDDFGNGTSKDCYYLMLTDAFNFTNEGQALRVSSYQVFNPTEIIKLGDAIDRKLIPPDEFLITSHTGIFTQVDSLDSNYMRFKESEAQND